MQLPAAKHVSIKARIARISAACHTISLRISLPLYKYGVRPQFLHLRVTMTSNWKICFAASEIEPANEARSRLAAKYGNFEPGESDAIVALGGDGFMLQTLNMASEIDVPVYGMNRGTVGFLMNEYSEDNLYTRLDAAEEEVINPLRMKALTSEGTECEALAINEVSLLRAGPQAVKLCITVDGKTRMDELICDGALISTPAGSTAYNYSAHGPILPIGSDVLALTAVAAFRPRRWRGALLRNTSRVLFEVLEPEKRQVMADADGRQARNVVKVAVQSEPDIRHRILFDSGHGLEERLIREQFA